MSFPARYGPWALVTGGARGLGAEFARQLADHGLNIVLVDQCGLALQAESQQLQHKGVEVRGVELDLARPDFLDTLQPLVDELEIGLLINCAAQSALGPFLEQEPALLSRIIAVNCLAPLLLTRRVAQGMRARGRGGIIFLSSLSAFQGAPLVASYASTKAFNQILGESLWAELREFGVDVLSLAPGPTDTWGFQQTRPNLASLAGHLVMPPQQVVTEALASLGHHPSWVPGAWNRLSRLMMHHLLPQRMAIGLLHRSLKELYPTLESKNWPRG